MHEFNVKLWRNQEQMNWSLEINGKRYEEVEIEMVEQLVHLALIEAEESLIALDGRPPQ